MKKNNNNNNDWKLPKVDERNESMCSGRSKYSKQDKLKEIYLRHIVIKLTKEKDREDLESSKRVVTSHRSILIRLTVDF